MIAGTRQESLEFRIHGMDCADEVAILKRELGSLVGTSERLSFDILRGKMTVAPGAPPLGADQVEAAVARTGMRAERWSDVQTDAAEVDFWQRRGRTVLTVLSGALAAAGFVVHGIADEWVAALGSEGGGPSLAPPLLSMALYLGAIVAGGWFVVGRAWRAAARLRPDMNLLMTIAVIGGIAIGAWFEAAVVSFLFATSLALESWSVGRARRAVDALLAIVPERARVLREDGTEVEVLASEVTVGAHIVIKPGDRIPLDATARRGSSSVNQAPITGESMPVPKGPGSELFAGTINGEGVLEAEVTRLAGASTLAGIIRMVGEAQSRRAPSEQWVDRFAQVYTPAVLGLAVLVAIGPPLVVGASWGEWFYRGLVLLVIGCPCALVISTPVSIVASLAAAAHRGVLVKGGVFIETPARLRALALDKTGTLTEGKPRIVDVIPMSGHTEDELLRAMAAMEARSDHPLARAIMAHVSDSGIRVRPADDVRALDGRGVTARIDGKEYWLGSYRFLEEKGQETPEIHAQIEGLSSAGRSVVVMGTNEHVCGLVTLADTVRPGSARAVAELRAAGIEQIVMLTGDNAATAAGIAKEVGITEVRAELLPADKVAAVEALVARHGAVGMIGDGVNDAPAMGRATLGVAMGAAGSDAAIEVADIALMADDLGKFAWLVDHSRRTLSIIRQNVGLSLGVKALSVILAFAGIATLWMAIAADMGVSLLVIANALRLLRGGGALGVG